MRFSSPLLIALTALLLLLSNSINAEPKYAKRVAEMNRLLEEQIRLTAPNNTDNAQARTGIGRWLQELQSELGAETYGQLREVAYYVRTLPLDLVAQIRPGRTANPENVRRVEAIVDEAGSKQIFPFTAEETSEETPEGIGIYTYTNFLKAVGAFPAYCGDYRLHPRLREVDPEWVCRRLLAATFAHFTKETSANAAGWRTPLNRQGLYFVREAWCLNGKCDYYKIGRELYPESILRGNTYFGRGAFQLSHPVNYGTLSLLLFGNEEVLVRTPDLVADTWLALGSAVSYVITPAVSRPAIIEALDGNYRPNSHDLSKHHRAGFGLTTFIVNGVIECMGHWIPRGQNGRTFPEIRADYYRYFLQVLKVGGPADPVESLTCEKMRTEFDEKSSSARPYYFSESECRPVKWFAKFTAYEGISGLRKCRKFKV